MEVWIRDLNINYSPNEASEGLEPLGDRGVGAPRRRDRDAVWRIDASECLPLHLKIDRRIPVRRVDTRVAQPMAHGHDINARF
jgi:hypothetical protein